MSKDQRPGPDCDEGALPWRVHNLEKRVDAIDGDGPTTIKSQVLDLRFWKVFLTGCWCVVGALCYWAATSGQAAVLAELKALHQAVDQRAGERVK